MGSLDERLERLGREIAAARAEAAARRDFEHDEIGDLLAAINDELAGVGRDDEAAAHSRCDTIEARLAEARARLAAPQEPKRDPDPEAATFADSQFCPSARRSAQTAQRL